MQLLTIAHWSRILVLVNPVRKTEEIQKRSLRIVLDNYGSNYDVLLK